MLFLNNMYKMSLVFEMLDSSFYPKACQHLLINVAI